MDEIDVEAIQRKAAELLAATKDIDAEVAAAVHEAWSAEGVDLTARRVNKKKSKLAMERFLRTYPELTRALVSRYEQMIAWKLADTGCIGMWMYEHPDELRAAWHDP